ncbi:MAG: hypothetical protein ACYC5Z_05695 [Acidimicrobiales bacterium]
MARRWLAVFALVLAIVGSVAGVATASTLGPTNAQRRTSAVLEARHLLAALALPNGSRGVARNDPSINRSLLSMGAGSIDPDQVDLTRFYVVVVRGEWALKWLQTHVPHGGTSTGWGTGSGPGQLTSHTLTFSFATPPTLSEAQLQYSMVVGPSGELGVRVDADVLWTPRKSRYALVAIGAAKVIVTMDRGLNVRSHRVTTVTVTSSATIDVIRSAINAAPVATPGVTSCPLDVGATMTLSFWRAGASGPFATVVADPGGCGGVTVTQWRGDGARRGVGHDSGGGAIVRLVATTLGIRDWMGAL